MSTIQVENIVKAFGSQRAVDGVSFEVNPGEIFGLLGPNGAGKTTTIRILLDIFKADSGRVSILGGAMTEEKKNRIGYLPEERGLYQEIKLEQCLTYLATLKGLSQAEATRRINVYLERFDLAEHRKKKLKELSKGMQQKAQLIVTLVHEPDVLIIDEPFSALDPVNTQMVKDLLLEERGKNRTIVLCTHQMHQVEELCDRIVLINQGKSVLYGGLEEIRRRFAGQDLLLRTPTELPAALPGVASYEHTNGGYHLMLSAGSDPQAVLAGLLSAGITVEQFEIAMPTMDEIFIRVVTGDSSNE
ncbi:MAG: ATP-binding cassette domain-containing protein [Chloroflexi bacterium]|nr:ATP-binding cassette domain-containing protein [Chloroflexota bacterium]